MHYLFIIVIIAIIVYFQISIFIDTYEKLKNFISVFSNNSKDYKLLSEEKIEKIDNATNEVLDNMLVEAGLNAQKYHYTRYSTDNGEIPCFRKESAKKDLKEIFKNDVKIVFRHNNIISTEIVNSINNYLSVNKSSVSDFHLIKDIVDRNCDAQEEEINTQIPIPLYLGLVGTMVGILVGIGYLWINGGLEALLSTPKQGNLSDEAFNVLKDTLSEKSVGGITALLGGVALAMTASILGILFTTFGSLHAKKTKANVERNKHIFLSWIQARLLPNLSNDTAQTLEKMSQNLISFNDTFSNNTSELGVALSQVNDSYRLQKQLFDTIRQIAEKDISLKNLQLYNVLKNSTEEIGTLSVYLNNVNDYLANVKALNEKLDASEQRTKSIEEMATFFKNEMHQVDARKGMMTKVVGTVDSVLQEAIGKLKDHANDQLEELKKTTAKQHEFLQNNSEHINNIVSELRNLAAVKDSILKFEQAARAQNSKLDNLAAAIQTLAKAKVEGTTISNGLKPQVPIYKKILIWSSSAVGSLAILFLILANWNIIAGFLNLIINLFKI